MIAILTLISDILTSADLVILVKETLPRMKKLVSKLKKNEIIQDLVTIPSEELIALARQAVDAETGATTGVLSYNRIFV